MAGYHGERSLFILVDCSNILDGAGEHGERSLFTSTLRTILFCNSSCQLVQFSYFFRNGLVGQLVTKAASLKAFKGVRAQRGHLKINETEQLKSVECTWWSDPK